MAATDQQVQNFVDQRIRPIAEQARALKIQMDDIIASIDAVYDALDPTNEATWTDGRADGPPNLLMPADVLAINTFVNNIRDAIRDNAQYPVVLKACVRAP